jgi:hypothetical protein
MNTTSEPRTLTTFTCRCGLKVQAFIKAGETGRCMDCRDEDSRKANGWTPENSRD